jgi:hypothetical protein
VLMEFKNKFDKNLALLILRRYISEFKTGEFCDKIIINDFSISFNKQCKIIKPILGLTDFYDKEYRDIKFEKENLYC